ncbi:transposon Tf2-6 polyprotein [Trichonephila clavipes]|uniref:Transposon Tf2-6 polyprotein n=1 Tax=Trichonephila clavipes TaxID=2585209 RepID=A0A8X6RN41_TRICX|nr:transposon Tf2-6 polyprotein [Trichonephila clavipes]
MPSFHDPLRLFLFANNQIGDPWKKRTWHLSDSRAYRQYEAEDKRLFGNVFQKKDQDLAKLKLLSNSSKNEEFRFIDGILCRKNFDPDGKLWLPVIPKHLRADILRHFHDAPTAGHLGFAKTYDRIRKRFYWPGMYRNVVRYVMHCRECQRRKSVPQRPPGRLVPIPPAIAPFHRIGIDLLGRFPKSVHGNKWIIVCTDYSTRYAITKALPTAEVDEIAKFLLEEIVLRHGAPRVIITDRGAVFRSRLVFLSRRLV